MQDPGPGERYYSQLSHRHWLASERLHWYPRRRELLALDLERLNRMQIIKVKLASDLPLNVGDRLELTRGYTVPLEAHLAKGDSYFVANVQDYDLSWIFSRAYPPPAETKSCSTISTNLG